MMTKKKIKLPLKLWKNPIRYIKFHKAMKALKKDLQGTDKIVEQYYIAPNSEKIGGRDPIVST